PLGERVPEGGVAHQHGVDDPLVVERELVLAQHAGPARLRHRPAVRGLDLARQYLHEGALAGAVRSGQSVTIARRELYVHVLEQRARPERLRYFTHYDN